jgi:hypothetical protein
LAVAAAVEAVSLVLAGARFERCDTGVAGELRVGVEAVDRADLAQQLGGAEWAAAGQREQCGGGVVDARLQFTIEREDRARQAAAAADELARDPDLHGLLAPTQATIDAVKPQRAVERAGRDDELRIEVVQLPAQPLLGPPALVDQVVAMVDEQLQLAQRRFTRPWTIQLRFPQGGSGDGKRVDRVGLAARTPGTPLGRHQLGRHPHQRLSGGKQPPLQPARQLPAILDRPQPFRSERARPGDQLSRRADGQLRDSPPELVDGNGRQ